MIRVLTILAAQLMACVALAQSPATQPTMRYGRIVSPEDKPVAGAKVFLVQSDYGFDPRTTQTTITDATGRFGFALTPPPEGTMWTVMARAEGYALIAADMTRREGEEPPVTKMVPPTEFRVHLLSPEGDPMVGLRVSVQRVQAKPPMDAVGFVPGDLRQELAQTTDQNGVCVFANLPRDWIVILDVPDERFAAMTYYDRIELADAPTTEGGIVRLVAAGSIAGRVTYSGDAKPAQGLRLGARPAGKADGGTAVTDTDGRFTITQLPPGKYSIGVNLPAAIRATHTATSLFDVPVTAGATTTDQNLSLITGAVIQGKLVEKTTGKPLAGQSISVATSGTTQARPMYSYATSRDDGSYSMHVPPGSQHVAINSDPPVGLLKPANDGNDFTLADGETHTLDLEFPPNPAPIVRGTVVDAVGKPIADATLLMTAVDGPLAGEITGSAMTDPDGRFAIAGAAAGATLVAFKKDLMTTDKVIVEDNHRDITVTIRKTEMASVLVRITLADGSPAAGVPVRMTYVESASGDFGLIGVDEKAAGADGTVIFKELSPIRQFDFDAGGNGFSRGGAGAHPTLQPGRQSEVSIVVGRADSFVGGRVVDENGVSLSGINVNGSSRGSGRLSTVTDANGRFFFNNIPAEDSISVFTSSAEGFGAPQRLQSGTNDVIIVHRPTPPPSRP